MEQTTIYVLFAIARKDGFKFSLGAFKNKLNALQAKKIHDEVTGKTYIHIIEEETILD